MKLHWTEWSVVTAVVGVACMAVYAAMARAMRRAVAEKQRETERQLSAMATTVNALQARVAELGGLNAMPAPQGERGKFDSSGVQRRTETRITRAGDCRCADRGGEHVSR